jgi:hypothetical protein
VVGASDVGAGRLGLFGRSAPCCDGKSYLSMTLA